MPIGVSPPFAAWSAAGPRWPIPGPFLPRQFQSAQMGAQAWGVGIDVPWLYAGTATGFLWAGANLNQGSNTVALRRIRGVMIDNSRCGAPVSLYIPSSGQIIRCGAGDCITATVIANDQEFSLYRGYSFLGIGNADITSLFFADETLSDMPRLDRRISTLIWSADINAGASGQVNPAMPCGAYFITSIYINIWQMNTTIVGGAVGLQFQDSAITYYDTYTKGPVNGANYNLRNELIQINYMSARGDPVAVSRVIYTLASVSIFACNIRAYGQIIP